MIDGRPQRPVSGQQLIQLAKDGGLRPDDDVWTEGMTPCRASTLKVLEGLFSGRKKDGHSGTTARPGPQGWLDIISTDLEAGRTVIIRKSDLKPGDLDLLQALYDLKVVDTGPSYSMSLRQPRPGESVLDEETDVQRGKPAIRSSPSRSSPRLTVECPHCGNLFEVDPNVDASCDECRLERAVSGTWHWPDGTPFLSRRRRRGHQS